MITDFFEYFNNIYFFDRDAKISIYVIFILLYIIYFLDSFSNNNDKDDNFPTVFDRFFFFKLFWSFVLFIFNISIILLMDEIIFKLFNYPRFNTFIIMFFVYVISGIIRGYQTDGRQIYLFGLTYRLSILEDLIIEYFKLKKDLNKNYKEFKQNSHLNFNKNV